MNLILSLLKDAAAPGRSNRFRLQAVGAVGRGQSEGATGGIGNPVRRR